MSQQERISRSLAVLATSVGIAVALALILSTAPLLGRRGDTAAASTRCTGGGGGPSPSPSPSDSATPTATPSSRQQPAPIQTTPTSSPTGSPSASPTEGDPDPVATLTGLIPGDETPTPSATPSETSGTAQRCNSEITIKHNRDRQVFSGRVRSDEAACRRGRRVQLKLDRRGKRDRTVGTAATTRKGTWRAAYPDPDGRRFYAKVTRSNTANQDGDVVCKPDRSRSIRAGNPR